MATYPGYDKTTGGYYQSNHYHPATAQWVNSTSSYTTTPYDYIPPLTSATNTTASSFRQVAQAAKRVGDALPKPKPPSFFDDVKAAFEKVKGGPMKPVHLEPELKDGKPLMVHGFPLRPIGGAAPDAEVDYEVIEDPPPAPAPPKRKKVVMKRTAGIRRDKGSGPVETHTGKVTFVRQMEGAGHLTENIGVRSEPNGSTNHIEIPKKMLLKALKELSLDDEDLAKELKQL